MNTEVFVRDEQDFKEVTITDPAKPEINDNILSKWQNLIDITSDIIGVSSALIMKITADSMEVFAKSENEANPYEVGGSDTLGHGLYCETVIARNEELYIKNALKSEVWYDNPDVDLKMISYYGLPINWPDEETFGTICILDDVEIELNNTHKKLFEEFKNVIEEDLNLLLKEQELKSFFDLNLDLLCIANTKGEFVKVNSAWEDLLGYDSERLEDMNFLDFVHPEDLDSTQKIIKKLMGNQKITNFINRFKDKAGNYHYIEWNLKANGNYIYAAARDVTNRRKQHEELEFQYQFQKTLAEISSSLLNINSANIERKINTALAKIGEFFNIDRSYIFQLSGNNTFITNTHEWCGRGINPEKENLVGLPASNFSWLMEKLYNNEYINIPDVEKMNSKAKTEQKLLKKQNIKSVLIMPMFIENQLFGFFGFDAVKDKREFSKEEIRLMNIFTGLITNAFSKYINDKRILKLTYNDSLTGLYNRRFFEKEIERLDTQRQLPISIIVADINGLKIINDSLGHKKGDELLIKSAELLKEVIREEDILARYGGDEFAILLPQTEKSVAEKIIKRIK
jgi:PAS domain S-box-containing protein